MMSSSCTCSGKLPIGCAPSSRSLRRVPIPSWRCLCAKNGLSVQLGEIGVLPRPLVPMKTDAAALPATLPGRPTLLGAPDTDCAVSSRLLSSRTGISARRFR